MSNVLLQTSGITRLMAVIAELFPLIMTVVMIMLVIGLVFTMTGGNRRKKGGLLAFAFVFFLIASAPVAFATASVSPGSTTVYDYMPTTEVFRGLSTGGVVEYEIRRGDAVTIELDDLYADSQGILFVQIMPYQDAANSYCLYNVTGSESLLTFTVTNNTIMDFLIPLFTIAIMVSVLSLILGIFTGRRW